MTALLRNMYQTQPSFKLQTLFSKIVIRGVQTPEFYDRTYPGLTKKLSQRMGGNVLGQPMDSVYSYVHGMSLK